MKSVIDRMIARARAPLSPVRPILPSRYETDRDRPAPEASGPAGDTSGVAETIRPDPAPRRLSPALPAAAGPRAMPAEAPALSPLAAARAAEPPVVKPGGASVRAGHVPAVPEDAPRSGWRTAPAPIAPPPAGTGTASPAARGRAPSGAGVAAPQPGEAVERKPTAGPAIARDRIETWTPRGPAPPDGEPSVTDPPPAADPSSPAVRVGATEVTISIGSIEVRSVPSAEPRRKPVPRPHVTLEEFLRRRETAGR